MQCSPYRNESAREEADGLSEPNRASFVFSLFIDLDSFSRQVEVKLNFTHLVSINDGGKFLLPGFNFRKVDLPEFQRG